MLSRHANELLARLERVADIGVAEIRKNELLTWYGQERLSAGVWRDVADKWREVLLADDCTEEEIEAIPLLVGDSEGLFVFVYGENLQLADPTSEDGWLWPIADWIKTKARK